MSNSKNKEPFHCETKSELVSIEDRGDDILIQIKNVRLGFPHIFEEDPNPDPKYAQGAKNRLTCKHYVTPKTYKQILKTVNKYIKRMQPSLDDGIKDIPYNNRRFFKKGDMCEIRTSSGDTHPPKYYDSAGDIVRDPLGAGADKLLSSGNYANVFITVSLSKNKRNEFIIWSTLVAIQFSERGDPLGKGSTVDEETVNSAFGKVHTNSDFDKVASKKRDDDDDFDDDDFDDDDFDDDIPL